MSIVTFNVGGVIYKTSVSTIDIMSASTNGTDLLGMLVRQNGNNAQSEIFIDRDHKLFRWILYAYRENIVPTHTDVRVSKEIWNKELAFYGIDKIGITEKPAGINQKKESTTLPLPQSVIEMEQQIKSISNNYISRMKENHKKQKINIENGYESRRPLYANLLLYLTTRSSNAIFVIVGKNGPVIPEGARTINTIVYNPIWVYKYKSEIQTYADSLGYKIHIDEINDNDNNTSFAIYPASVCNHIYTKHHKTSIRVSLFHKQVSAQELSESSD
jgi:hypothetical protein